MTASVDELKRLLHQDLASLDSLRAVLQEEREALGANNMSGLEELLARKNELIDHLRETARQKVRHLVAVGFNPSSGSPSAFLKSLADLELETLWRDAHQAMSACQSVNNVNGQVVNHLQKRAGRLSEIIRGVNPNQKLYGAAGREESMGHKSVLANA